MSVLEPKNNKQVTTTVEIKKPDNFFRILGKFKMAIIFLGGVLSILAVLKLKPEWLGVDSQTASKVTVEKELTDTVLIVEKIIDLPDDETPTLATVTESEKLSNQEFFRKAKDGDKVLVFQNAKRAYLYRPSENRIIEVGVVNTDLQENTNPVVTAIPSPTATITTTPTSVSGDTSEVESSGGTTEDGSTN